MNGIHDLGGRHGHGPIDIDPGQPVFHADWERRTFGLMLLTFAGGHYNIDEFRSAIEEMKPSDYLLSGYYEHWLHALEALCVRNGSLSRQEIDDRVRQLAQEAG